MDQSYQVIRRISAGDGLEGDLHEFLITPDNTALLTIYERTDADLSSVDGPMDGKIWDCLFQEIDLETNRTIFQWRASDHFDFSDTFRSLYGMGNDDSHWDWFHINSVEKDERGNYLISSRYTHSLAYIDGQDGQVLWNLGGKLNDFEDLSDGRALSFAGQHDARWHENQTVITLFDNGADYDTHSADSSRGMRIGVDVEGKMVDLLQEYVNSDRTLSKSQGSMQTLSNGNVLLGYGFNAFVTEFDARGKVLCEMHLTPSASTGTGDVQSYRAFKQAWKGYPNTSPSIALGSGKVYLSWNGATEVAHWVLKAGDDETAVDGYRDIATFPKTGFETQWRVERGQVVDGYVVAMALDSEGTLLGMTEAIEFEEEDVSIQPPVAPHSRYGN